MPTARAPKAATQALILSPKDEEMLAAFPVYRYLPAKDLCYLLRYSPKSLTHVRERLARLCGHRDLTDKDFIDAGYPLLRFCLPSSQLGGRERIFALSSTGRAIVESLGLPVSFHVKPSKLTFSHSHLMHTLTLNRSIIAFHAWSRSKPNITIESSLSWELSKNPPLVSIPMQGQTAKVSVICDALLLITNVRTNQRVVIVWEIDHNTQAQERFRSHIAARLFYAQIPHFTNIYGNIPFRIAYATSGLTQSASQARLHSMLNWSSDILSQLKKEEYARFLRFTTINFATIFDDSHRLFEGAVWYRPDDPTTPVPLLTD